MASAKQLKVLKAGAEDWKLWRLKGKEAHPSLSGADLSNANLSRAFLSQVSCAGPRYHRQ
jgi:hypothetical protein